MHVGISVGKAQDNLGVADWTAAIVHYPGLIHRRRTCDQREAACQTDAHHGDLRRVDFAPAPGCRIAFTSMVLFTPLIVSVRLPLFNPGGWPALTATETGVAVLPPSDPDGFATVRKPPAPARVKG